MQVILLHIGKALKNIMKLKDHNCRKCLASKLKAHHQLFKIKSLKILKRLQLLFELVIPSWDKATNALKESNGLIDSVTDDEILEAYQLMTTKEGVFSEPASNASIAGLIKLHRQGKLPQGKK